MKDKNLKDKNLTAVIIGATGLVGNEILLQTLESDQFAEVTVFTRRATGVSHPKLREHIVDFKNQGPWRDQIQGDVAFSALGTTRAQAGSVEAQYEVDFTYQAQIAKACADHGVATFVLISSMGANAKSFVPYSRMKGELEEFSKKLNFTLLSGLIFRNASLKSLV